MEITKEIKEKYIDNPLFCPFCEVEGYLIYDSKEDYGEGNRYVSCTLCGKKFLEIYKLVDIEPIED